MKKIKWFFLVAIGILYFFYKDQIIISVPEASANLENKISGAENHSSFINSPNSLKNIFTDSKRLTQEEEIYCFLKKQNLDIPLGGDVRIYGGREGELGEKMGMFAWVYSQDCPPDHYSIVRYDKFGELKMLVDCRKTSFTELAKESGMIGNMVYQPPRSGEVNLGISGPGYFFLYCPDDKNFVLTRNGHFVLNELGMVENENGCFLFHNGDSINAHGGPLSLDNEEDPKVDDNGCFKNGQCIAMLDPHDEIVESVEYVNPKNMFVDIKEMKAGSLKNRVTRSVVLENHLEDLDNPSRSPTGVDFLEFQSINENVLCAK